MGGLCGGTSGQIDNYLDNKENEEKATVKLLLLGPGSTGKSTLFKSLQILHSGKIKESEREFTTQIIRENITIGIHTLITQSKFLYQKDPEKYSKCLFNPESYDNKEDVQSAVELVDRYQNKTLFTQDAIINYDELRALSLAVTLLWSLEPIKATYHNHFQNFAFDDNLDYFFDMVDPIMKEDYVPTDRDCLKNRAKTTGMNEYMYDGMDGKRRFKIVDVGGQRSERRKWLHYFDNVNGLLFVASLIDYNTVIYEDETMNGMKETVNLFEEMTSKPAFKGCDVILILNKNDLLCNLLEKPNNGLADCFSERGGWDKDNKYQNEYWNTEIDEKYQSGELDFNDLHDAVIKFILHLFQKRHNTENTKEDLYHHVTVATDNNIVKKVFHDIQSMIVNTSLVTSGLV